MRRLTIALSIGLIAGAVCAARLAANPQLAATDLTWSLHGARALVAHQNPYHVAVGPPYSPAYPPLRYPLPAVLLLLPLTPFPDPIAAGVFVGLSTALLVFGLRREQWPILVCAPFCQAVITAQWSILLAAALLLPWLAPLIACKPTGTGATVLAACPTRWRILAPLLFALLSVAVLPNWPLDWLANTRAAPQQIPALVETQYFASLLLLLAALRWRRPGARIVLALSVVPLRLLWYDQLALFFAMDGPRARLIWLVCGWAAYVAWAWAGQVNDAAPWFVLVGCYAPALVGVLRDKSVT